MINKKSSKRFDHHLDLGLSLLRMFAFDLLHFVHLQCISGCKIFRSIKFKQFISIDRKVVMFNSCVSGTFLDDTAVNNQPPFRPQGAADPTQSNHSNHAYNSNESYFGLTEREILDKVLEEGMKLKRKNKQLRILLLDNETMRMEDKKHYENQLSAITAVYEQKINEMVASHYMEKVSLKDENISEQQHLREENELLREENERFRSQYDQVHEAIRDAETSKQLMQRSTSIIYGQANKTIVSF